MGQVDAADQGFTRFLRVLMGDTGWAASLFLSTPRWLIEGDAVSVETRLTNEGRGRDPLFTQELKALIVDNPQWSYNRVANPSYKNHHTDIYRFGYAMADWIRDNFGEEALGEIFRRSARIGIPVAGLNIATTNAVRRLPKQLFRKMADDMIRRAELERSTGSWTPGEVVSAPSVRFTRYDPLLVDAQGDVFVRRIDQARPSRLVRIGENRREVNLMRLPKSGRVSMSEKPGDAGGGYRLVWASLRRHPVFVGMSVSDLNVVDLGPKGRVRNRRRPVTGSRLRYPSLSPNGEKIAAVDILRGGGSALVILDAHSGDALHRLPLPSSTAAYPSWSPDGTRLVFSRSSSGGREIAEWRIGLSELKVLTPRAFETVKRPVYSADGKTVYFSSNAEATETVRAVSPERGERSAAARRWYGAYDPLVSPDGEALYVVEYASSRGEQLVRIAVGDLEGGAAEAQAAGAAGRAAAKPEGAEAAAVSRKGGAAAAQAAEADAFPESRYYPARHALNIHSWNLGADPFNLQRVSLSASSRDVLGTL